MNLLEILRFSQKYLEEREIPKARLTSEKIIAHVLHCDKISLYANFDRTLQKEEKEDIKYFLKRIAEERRPFEEVLKDLPAGTGDHREENRELLRKSVEYLEKYGVPSPETDAEYIFAHILGTRRALLTMQLAGKIEEEDKNRIREMLWQRGKLRKPLQYILGEWEFYGYPFRLDERVLIPRIDTETLVEQAKHILTEWERPRILDIGCGSGAISIALALELPKACVTGVDINPGAVEVSRSNKELNKVANAQFLQSDLFARLQGQRFHMILSNPPYISAAEYETLMPEIVRYEPKNALTDGADGLRFYERIARDARLHLEDGGCLVFEIGSKQAKAVREILEKYDFQVLLTGKDYGGNDRVVAGRIRGEDDVDKT